MTHCNDRDASCAELRTGRRFFPEVDHLLVGSGQVDGGGDRRSFVREWVEWLGIERVVIGLPAQTASALDTGPEQGPGVWPRDEAAQYRPPSGK